MRRSTDNPMAARPLARIARLVAAQGNIRISNSGMNLSGQKRPASPKAKPNSTMEQSAKVLTIIFPCENSFTLNRG